MQTIKPYAEIMWLSDRNAGIQLLRKIEYCARVSHRSEEAMTDSSWHRFLTAVVLQHGDWSVTEHGTVTVDAIVDRGVTHEWVRHRLGAYTQESTRFCNYGKSGEIKAIVPFEIVPDGEELRSWIRSISDAELEYLRLLKAGYTPQIARSVLPNALASRLITTFNLRQWRHFFLMRTCKEAHPQMKEVTIPLLVQFKERIPLLYDDILPERWQADNLRIPQ